MSLSLKLPGIELPADLLRALNLQTSSWHTIERVRITFWETGGPEIFYIQAWLEGIPDGRVYQLGPEGALGVAGETWHEWLDEARQRKLEKFGR